MLQIGCNQLEKDGKRIHICEVCSLACGEDKEEYMFFFQAVVETCKAFSNNVYSLNGRLTWFLALPFRRFVGNLNMFFSCGCSVVTETLGAFWMLILFDGLLLTAANSQR